MEARGVLCLTNEYIANDAADFLPVAVVVVGIVVAVRRQRRP
jgi:TRAP-type C4-dicarboxylate transport system permease small subunit